MTTTLRRDPETGHYAGETCTFRPLDAPSMFLTALIVGTSRDSDLPIVMILTGGNSTYEDGSLHVALPSELTPLLFK